MRRTIAAIVFAASAGVAQTAAAGDGCMRSRDELLSSGRALPQQAQTYQSLFRTCIEAATMSNVKEAYILKDGGIAVMPERDGLAATSITLAQFCRRFPRATLRILDAKTMRATPSIRAITEMSSGGSTSCQSIAGKLS